MISVHKVIQANCIGFARWWVGYRGIRILTFSESSCRAQICGMTFHAISHPRTREDLHPYQTTGAEDTLARSLQ